MSAPRDRNLDNEAHAAEYLEVARKKYEEGHKEVLLMALHFCLTMNRPAPEWLRRAFIQAYEAGAGFEIRTWDEVFGAPQEKGAHLDAQREYRDARLDIALRVALRAPKERIEPDFFDKIGVELGISKTKASDIYYKHGGKELQEIIEPLMPYLRERINSEKK